MSIVPPVVLASADGWNVVAFVMNAGLVSMVTVPFLAAGAVKLLRRGDHHRGDHHRRDARRAGQRAVEIDDVFQPSRREQIDCVVAEDMLRVDAESGDGDPLDAFGDGEELRDQLDPEGSEDPRRRRSRRARRRGDRAATPPPPVEQKQFRHPPPTARD